MKSIGNGCPPSYSSSSTSTSASSATISNIKLIPIYTDWANRQLSKTSATFRPIRNISDEFRDYRVVSQLINVIVPINEQSSVFSGKLSKITTNIDGLDTCLEYLKSIGLDCTKLTKTDIDSGNLGAVLQLLYLLSTFKQKLRQLKKDQKKQLTSTNEQPPPQTTTTITMPPALSKLPSPQQRGTNHNFISTQMSSNSTSTPSLSKIQPPTSRIAKPTSGSIELKTNTTIGKTPKGTGLKPPSTTTNLTRPSSRSSGNNNVSTTSVKSLDSSSAYSSTSNLNRPLPSIPIPKTSTKNPVRVATTTKVASTTSSKIATPKTALSTISTPKIASVKTIGTTKSETDCTEKSVMLKLKLFNNKNSGSTQNTPKIAKKTEIQSTRIGIPTQGGKSGLKPPGAAGSKLGSASSISKLNTPKINYRSTEIESKSTKRCSKSSEEESGYAGFSSTSPASSSTEGSLSMHSASSKSSSSSQDDKSPSSDDLTLNSSIITAIRQPIVKNIEDKPTLAVKGMMITKKEQQQEKGGGNIGVVSPIMAHKKTHEVIPIDEKPGLPPEKDDNIERPNLPELIKTDIIESGSLKSFERVPPQMAPIRQPPTYDQLLKQGKITSPVRTPFGYGADSSTSEDSISAITQQTVRHSKDDDQADNQTISKQMTDMPSSSDKRMKKNKNSESSGYTSETGVALCAKIREKLKEYDEMTRRAQEGYPDNFEDSSSLSSGISDNIEFDDISTDDVSSVDMATVASKHGDYSHFVRPSAQQSTSKTRSSRPSTSVDSRIRTMAEQENIHKLLSQCRTSKRGTAATTTTTGQPTTSTTTFGQHSIRSPGYATYSPHLTVSADKDTMSMHSQSRRSSSSQNKQMYPGTGFHSLDRKCHLQEFATPDNRIAALLSPRRVPNIPKHQYEMTSASSLNASGMSRSMILLETLSPRPPRRHQSPASSCFTPPTSSRRSHSPRAPTARIPLSIASPVHANNKGSQSARSHSRGPSSNGIYSTYNGADFQLYRFSDEVNRSPAHSSRSEMGSQLSLASTTAYASLNDKYESAIREMTRDLDCYRNTIDNLTKKQENYGLLFDMFEQKLQKLTHHIDKSNLKPEEAVRFRHDIANLREISTHMAANVVHHNDGAGELLRQPSLESVASHRSSMSSSSKSSKQEKMSLNSFGKSKKSWALTVDSQIRSSLSKFTKRKSKNSGEDCHMPSISGSHGALDSIDVMELRQELKDRDTKLTEIRFDVLDRDRQFDKLKETVNKLKYENKQLKKEMDRLTNGPTRASSQASLPVTHDEDPVYDAACTSTSGSVSSNSKRSSGCNSIKVTVNVDLAGEISSIVCPDNEIIVGYLTMPTSSSTWKDIDLSILSLFESYLQRIDVDKQLNLDATKAILGYQIGDMKRNIGEDTMNMNKMPIDTLQPTTTIRMFMNGAMQSRVDSLVLDTLLPKQMIIQLVKYITTQRRLVLAGATGIGKSKLAKSLASYICLRTNQSQDDIVDISIPENNDGELLNVERKLEKILQNKKPCIVLLDNIPKNRIAFVSSVFANVPLKNDEGPFVLCTVNRYQIPEMQLHQNFKMFLLTNKMDPVNGFMLRFLRRRTVEAEYRQFRQTPSEMIQIIQFLPLALQAVNLFIEKTNSIDVTIGPRVFLQCPLSVDESRQWFTRLWNDNFIPYMERVAREGKKTFGRCSSFEDPTDFICEKWPWLDGVAPEECLQRLSLQDIVVSSSSKQQFNPLESLIQLHATKHSVIDNI